MAVAQDAVEAVSEEAGVLNMKIKKGPFKGMLRVDAGLLKAGSNDLSPTDGLVFKRTDPLSITPAFGGNWKITHRASGRSVGGWRTFTERQAVKQLRTLLPLGKWDAIYKALYK